MIVEAPIDKLQRLQQLRVAVAERRDATAQTFSDDLAGWVNHRTGGFMWSKQVEIGEAVRDHRRTAVKSCHGVGKSWTAAQVAAHWLDTHEPGTAFVVTSAPTFPQVRAILWKEIGRVHRKGKLAGKVNQTEWWLNDEIVAFGRKPADYDEAAFQGIHARYVLVILDEACGIPEQLWVAANALATNDDCRILAIGNPDDPNSHFAKVCQPDSGWHVIRISVWDSPNFTDEQVPEDLTHLLVGHTYLDEMQADVGEGSAIWQSKIEGDFPVDAEDSVVRASKLARCRREDQPPDDGLPVELGVDVGGSEKGDRTVIRERRGNKAGKVWRFGTSDSAEVVQHVTAAIVETGATVVKIDSIGIGWGVAGHLEEKHRNGEHGARIVKVNVGESPRDTKRFTNLRDELWWSVGRGMTEDEAWDLSGIDDRTAADLTAPKWAPDPRGRIKVEKKDETRKRLGRSPDDADALLLAFFHKGAAGREWLEELGEQKPAEPTEWSPASPMPEPQVESQVEATLNVLQSLPIIRR